MRTVNESIAIAGVDSTALEQVGMKVLRIPYLQAVVWECWWV
jgi:hypothetical protein